MHSSNQLFNCPIKSLWAERPDSTPKQLQYSSLRDGHTPTQDLQKTYELDTLPLKYA